MYYFLGLLCVLLIIVVVKLEYKSTLQGSVRALQAQNKSLQKEINESELNLTRLKQVEDSYSKIKEEYESSQKFYEEKKIEHDKKIAQLEQEKEKAINEVNKLKAEINAGVKARLLEQESREKIEFYCIPIGQNELNDIKVLEDVKPLLRQPRVLSMLIWTTFFRDKVTKLCNNVLGAKTVCGIYKITNRETLQSYIGQSTDIATRWKQHVKCGLDIDRPSGNRLYNAMVKDGIWNFSWELLETCQPKELNEREKFYINLYQTDKFGYNLTAGNMTKGE